MLRKLGHWTFLMKMLFEYLKRKLQGKPTVLFAKTVSGGLDPTHKLILYFRILLHSITLYTQLLQSLMQLFVHQIYSSTTFSTSVFSLVQHVSATLGHNQALLLSLLKLSHCNLAFLCIPIHLLDALFHFCLPLAQVHLTNFNFVHI
jgi:hypothetical protein